jgi:anti-sigma regulatory factor (Ser/Thr protein kinase)
VIAGVTAPTDAEVARSATLRVPAKADALPLVRLFAASVGRHVDLPPEVVGDLKLALTEVCSAAVEVARSDDDDITVTVSLLIEGDRLAVHVSASRAFSTGDPASDDRARLLDALRLDVRTTDQGHGVQFALPTTSPH